MVLRQWLLAPTVVLAGAEYGMVVRWYYGGLGWHFKSCKLLFDTYKVLFEYQVVVLHLVIDKVFIVKRFFKILIYTFEVGVVDFYNVFQLAADTGR